MFSDKNGILKLQEGVEQKLEENRAQNKKILEHKKGYKTLEDKLSTLTDKISHDVMVPFTTKAFMPGKLIHTNEIQVLLGENYFLECSAKHAKEICKRRIKKCDQIMKELEQELSLVEGWKTQTNQLKQEQDECKEINEHFTEEQLNDWRRKHKESVQREKQKEKKIEKKKELTTDEELWQRLEELEVREALEKEWENEENLSSQDEDSESEEDSEEEIDDVEPDSDEGFQDNNERVIVVDESFGATGSKNVLKRSVSFADIKQENDESSKEIRFTFSTAESEPYTETEFPSHPGDLSNLQTSVPQNLPKSILKVPHGYDPIDHILQDQEPTQQRSQPSDTFVNPVNDLVQEQIKDMGSGPSQSSSIKNPRNSTNYPNSINPRSVPENVNIIDDHETEPVISKDSVAAMNSGKRVSKFKAMRAKQK